MESIKIEEENLTLLLTFKMVTLTRTFLMPFSNVTEEFTGM